MGVQGLWQLLDPLGRPVTLERLENKVLGIDASIWIHQAVRGFRDEHGNPLPNAHLMGFFHRICKLLFYCIKPVFVFDGAVPQLKRKTMAARRERQQKAVKDVEATRQQILHKHLQSLVIRQALAAGISQSPSKSSEVTATISSPREAADLYELPPLPPTLDPVEEGESSDEDDPEHSDAWMTYRSSIFQNLDDLDLDSADFRALPLDIQQEFLLEIKERNKRRSFIAEDAMPEDPEEIGNFQIGQLLRRRRIQRRLDEISKNVDAARAGDVVAGLDADMRLTLLDHQGEMRRINSEDSSHYFLFKRIHRTMARNKIAANTGAVTEECPSGKAVAGYSGSSDRAAIDTEVLDHEPDDLALVDSDKEMSEVILLEKKYDSQPLIVKEYFTTTDSDSLFQLDSAIKIDLDCSRGSMAAESGSLSLLESTNCEPNLLSPLEYQSNYGSSFPTSFTLNNADVETKIALKPNPYSHPEPQPLKNEPHSLSGVVSLKREACCGVSPAGPPTGCNVADRLEIVSSVDELPTAIVANSVASANCPGVDSGLAESNKVARDSKMISAIMESAPTPKDPKPEIDCSTIQGNGVSLHKVGSQFQAVLSNEVPLSHAIVVPSYSKVDLVLDDSEDDDADDFIEVENKSESESVERESAVMNIFDSDGDDGGKDESIADYSAPVASSLNEIPSTEPLPHFLSSATSLLDLDELRLVGEELNRQTVGLQQEKATHERVAVTIADQAYVECQELLRLFGVPYVVSPAEAEAQCAMLDRAGLTEGTVTEDSDIWLFGATRVYKNFFEKDRDVSLYTESDIARCLHLDRSKLIALALLTGSDYTEGVHGVGVVSAVEVLAEFPDADGVESLHKLYKWWSAPKDQRPSSETRVKKNLRKVELAPGFPNPAVVHAYLEPTVDESKERFSWATPDLDALRTFGRAKLGWSKEKVDSILLPVIKRLNAIKERQTRMETFFHPVPNDRQATTSMSGRHNHSQRLKRALSKVQPARGGGGAPSDRVASAAKRRPSGRQAVAGRGAPRKLSSRGIANRQQMTSGDSSSDGDLLLSDASSGSQEDDLEYNTTKRKRRQ